MLGLGVVLEHCILETSGAEGYHWCTSTEELMLHDPARLEHGGHYGEIASDVDQGPIYEEHIGIAPETMGELMIQELHFVSAVLAILFFAIRHASNEELNLEVVLIE